MPTEGSTASASLLTPIVTPLVAPSGLLGGNAGISLGDARVLKCKRPGTKVPPDQCDHQTFFEEALAKAISENGSCAPGAAGTISYVLSVDYSKRTMKLWAGKSGSIKRAKSKEAIACVKKSLSTPDWAQLSHQSQQYEISVLATYPAPSTSGGSSAGK